ncbi:MAG: response regulator [Acidobacteriota bacterium]
MGNSTAKNHILLIDDEKVIREIGQEMIEHLGYKCIIAKDGEEGIKLFRKNSKKILIVVLDVEMPGISGEVVSKTISEEVPDARILFISGYDRDYLEKKVFGKEIENFIPKPLSVKSLSRKFNEMLRENAV